MTRERTTLRDLSRPLGLALGMGAAAACAMGLGGCPEARRSEPRRGEPSSQPGAAAFAPSPIPPIAPITFFERACTNCHGSYGMLYGEEFAKNLDDAALVHIVREMVTGPARTGLDDASLAALVAFHRQLAAPANGPFIAITRFDGAAIAGEVSPNARVIVVADGREIEASVTEHVWRVQLETAPARSLRVRAWFPDGRGATELDAAEAAWSHRVAGPAQRTKSGRGA